MNYWIKEIEKNDLCDFLFVNTSSWLETYKSIVNDDYLNWMKENFDNKVKRNIEEFDRVKVEEPDYKRFLLFLDDEPVGMFSVSNSREEEYPNCGELCTLYLLNKAKGNGLGRVMFERAKDEIRKLGFSDMVLCCFSGNPTNEFYKHMGGKFVSTKTKKIGEQELVENIYYFEGI